MSHSPTRQVFLLRHGETEWSKDGRHTGRTDIPLTEEGRRQAGVIERYLRGRAFRAWTSPLGRALETCRIAGFGDVAQIDPDLLEWDYGIYEGRSTLEIRRETPEWSVWHSPIAGGEALDDVAARANRVIERVSAVPGDVALFAHGHFLRILASCWMGLPPLTGRHLGLDTASISILGYERQTRVIRQWNFIPPECAK